MRQPKSTHEKRKLRLSPNKYICSAGKNVHILEFAFYQIHNMNVFKTGYTHSNNLK